MKLFYYTIFFVNILALIGMMFDDWFNSMGAILWILATLIYLAKTGEPK